LILWVQYTYGLSDSSHSLESKTSSAPSDDENDDMVMFGEEYDDNDVFDHIGLIDSDDDGDDACYDGACVKVDEDELIEWNSLKYWIDRINIIVNESPIRSNRNNHHSHQVVPSLYIGSEDLDLTQGYWTHVLRCIDSTNAFRDIISILPESVIEIQNHCLEEDDDDDRFLTLDLYKKAEDFINNSICNGGTVLLTCNDGVNYSPAIAVAYLMRNHGKSLLEAISFCKDACEGDPVLLNPKLQHELVEFTTALELPLC